MPGGDSNISVIFLYCVSLNWVWCTVPHKHSSLINILLAMTKFVLDIIMWHVKMFAGLYFVCWQTFRK